MKPKRNEPSNQARSALLCPLAPAHFVGLGALQLAFLLLFFDMRLTALPLALFVMLVLLAPFFPRWRLFLPVETKGTNGVSLTFDDGPDEQTTHALLDLLAKHEVKATFFLVGERAAENESLVARILKEGHEIGNHTMTHDIFLMLRSKKRLAEEIDRATEAFASFHIRPLAFRPPVGIVNPKLFSVLLSRGMFHAGWRVKANEMGNRRIGGLAKKLLQRTRDGDVILLHDKAPRKDRSEKLLAEIERLILGLKERGLAIKPLSALIGRVVMERTGETQFRERAQQTARFYDAISAHYDAEQESASMSPARVAEIAAFEKRRGTLFPKGARVLEIGAGSGRFTLPLAQRAEKLVALDISKGMLTLLEAKAKREGISNISIHHGTLFSLSEKERFDAVCAFSSLEYIFSLAEVAEKVHTLLNPGGVFYFTTAHRSFFRFFAQLGNAMRQGIWLKARGKCEAMRVLKRAGFERIEIQTMGMKLPLVGGILLEAKATKHEETKKESGR